MRFHGGKDIPDGLGGIVVRFCGEPLLSSTYWEVYNGWLAGNREGLLRKKSATGVKT